MRRFAAAAALCVLTAQSPAPSTLPEIGRTHSKGFCSTVRDNVAPSLLGLMKTDELIGASHRATLKMAHDQTSGSTEAQDIDRLYLGKVVSAMAHNLGVIKKVLADEKRFPKTPLSDDDRFALLLKAQLQATAERQNVALNHLNGILETTAMGQMRGDVSTQMNNAVGQSPAGPRGTPKPPASTADQFLGVSSLPGSGPGGMFEHPGPALTNVAGQTIWDKLTADIEVQQARIAGAEQTLTPTVIAASLACQAPAAPAPAASP
jgi:hypothetical protein